MVESDATATPASEPDSDTAARTRTTKSPEAFRTISEAAGELGLPQHVLRFWESKFPQVKPLKRGGGRRYYRPEDIVLLTRIRDWLHVEGYTIKGVQKLLRDPAQRNGTATSEEVVADNVPAATLTASTHTASSDDVDRAIERLTTIRQSLLKTLGD